MNGQKKSVYAHYVTCTHVTLAPRRHDLRTHPLLHALTRFLSVCVAWQNRSHKRQTVTLVDDDRDDDDDEDDSE